MPGYVRPYIPKELLPYTRSVMAATVAVAVTAGAASSRPAAALTLRLMGDPAAARRGRPGGGGAGGCGCWAVGIARHLNCPPRGPARREPPRPIRPGGTVPVSYRSLSSIR